MAANIKYLNYFGNTVVLKNVKELQYEREDGSGKESFSHGKAVENVPITLDFSGGDQTVIAPEGTLVKSAVIIKPENLVPENIADGENVAGILGTHKGGGGGVSTLNVVQKTGSYTATTTGEITVTHNLGVLPDIIIVTGNKNGTSGAILSITAMCKEISETLPQTVVLYNSSNNLVLNGLSDIYSTEADSFGLISNTTPNTFQVGGTILKHISGEGYSWIVIGGLFDRTYLHIKLYLDGDGHLIITGGVPEIERLNIYVDGELAKIIDYVHGDEVIIDISDVASEFKEYTISVDGVGETLAEKYPMAFYEPITGYVVSLNGSCGESVNYKLFGNGTLRIYGTGPMADYSAASGQPWYNEASSIKSVIVENGVTRIGSQSLRQLTNMTEISIADSVTSYGTSAFLGSTALSEITISENVTAINAYAFNECTGLKNAYFEGTLEQWCKINLGGTGANPCTVGKATLYIGGETLVNAVIPESITALNDYIFMNCKTLVSVSMHEGVQSIGNRAFYGCSNITDFTMSNGVTSIGGYAFYNCTSITNITIPEGVTKIGEYAFYATQISSIVIPNSVTEILWRAFQNCTMLTSVTIGNAVNLIGDNTFYGCNALSSATFKDVTTWVRNSSQTSTTGTTIFYESLQNTSTAAMYLRSTYVSYWWHKI